MKRIAAATLLLLLLAGSAACVFSWVKLNEWGREGKVLQNPVDLSFPAGTRLAVLSAVLHEKGLIDNERLFGLWVKFFANYARFKAGEYRFEGAVTPESIAAKLEGGGTAEITAALEITVPEGFTLRQVVERLAAKNVGTEEDLWRLSRDPSFMNSLHVQADSLEGYIYPATYRFNKFPSGEDVFRETVNTFWKNLPKEYETNIGYLGLSLQQAVIFASLIELETPFDEERPLVSEVIWRRLKANLPLAIDAAVIYGIKDYRGNITRRHLEDRENKYNTRIYSGLPPSPICSPSTVSLQAVLTPSREGYLYYVLDTESGRHHFSKSAEEHTGYVQKLVAASKALKASSR